MPTAMDILSDLTRSPNWPRQWMTVAEIAAELEGLGFWEQPLFQGYQGAERLAFVAGLLSRPRAEEERTWVQRGSQFKQAAMLTLEDQALVQEWLEERQVAFDEELGRILLGVGKQ